MSGVKIITVLKDDAFPEILDLFRRAPAGEVIFVLPKNGKVFRTEDQFAAFAAEASTAQKRISIMSPNTEITALAQKYGFTVVHAGKTPSVKKPNAKLASLPPPQDPDIQDFSQDAFEDDVVVPSDEKPMNVMGEEDEETDPLRGMHIEEELTADLAVATVDSVRGGRGHSVPIPQRAERTQSVPVSQTPEGNPDYLDTMWRDKVGLADKGKRLFTGALKAASVGGRRVSRGMVIGILVVAVGLLGAALSFMNGSAVIEIAPVSKAIIFQLTAQTSATFSSVDSTFNKLPGQLLEIAKTATATQKASGSRNVASKARGTLTVFNTYSSSPQSLIATTRFLSEDGKVFRTLQSITVPGSTGSGDTMVPGKTTVPVIADRPGEEYNGASGKFIIAAFQEKGDVERVAKIYGMAEQPMSGGANGPSNVITQEDYEAAVATASADARTAVSQALPPESQGLTVLGSDAPPIILKTTTAQPDDAGASVTVTMESSLVTVAFRTSDLADLLRASALSRERVVVLPDQLKLTFSNVSYDVPRGVLTFVVSASGTGYAPIDISAVTQDLIGKNAAAVQEYFKNRATDIDAAEVRFSPFWTKRIPKQHADITINLRYGDVVLTPSPEQ